MKNESLTGWVTRAVMAVVCVAVVVTIAIPIFNGLW